MGELQVDGFLAAYPLYVGLREASLTENGMLKFEGAPLHFNAPPAVALCVFTKRELAERFPLAAKSPQGVSICDIAGNEVLAAFLRTNQSQGITCVIFDPQHPSGAGLQTIAYPIENVIRAAARQEK